MVITKLDCPDACARADIENFAWVVADGCEVELVAETDSKHLMGKVETVQFALFNPSLVLHFTENYQVRRGCTSSLGIT